MNSFSRSWSLLRSTLRVLQADKEMVWYPVMATVVTFLVSMVIFGLVAAAFVVNPELAQSVSQAGQAMDDGDASSWQTILFFVLLFLYYLIMAFIGTYFMTGLAGMALMRFDGQDPTFRDGLRIASSRLGSILGFSVISATVGVVLSALRNRSGDSGNAAGAIIASLGDFAWSVATFLVVPLIAAKGGSPLNAIKESTSMLRRTWGEQLIGAAGIGFVFGVLIVLVAVLGGLLAFAVASSSAALFSVIVITVVLIALLAVISSTLNGIYRAAVYRYAATGQVAQQFDNQLIETAFRPKRASASI